MFCNAICWRASAAVGAALQHDARKRRNSATRGFVRHDAKSRRLCFIFFANMMTRFCEKKKKIGCVLGCEYKTVVQAQSLPLEMQDNRGDYGRKKGTRNSQLSYHRICALCCLHLPVTPKAKIMLGPTTFFSRVTQTCCWHKDKKLTVLETLMRACQQVRVLPGIQRN